MCIRTFSDLASLGPRFARTSLRSDSLRSITYARRRRYLTSVRPYALTHAVYYFFLYGPFWYVFVHVRIRSFLVHYVDKKVPKPDRGTSTESTTSPDTDPWAQ